MDNNFNLREEDLRIYLKKEELIKLSDFKLQAALSKTQEEFEEWKSLVNIYYEIAHLRKQLEATH